MKKLFVVGLNILIFSVDLFAQSCPADIAGYWPLDTNGDEVINGLPGNLAGTVYFQNAVVGGGALLLGDGSYIDAGAHPELTTFGGSQLSLMAWVYRYPDGPAGDSESPIITARTPFCAQGNFQFYDRVGSNVFFSTWTGENQDYAFSGITVPEETWTHLSVTYNGNEVRFYLDGELTDIIGPLTYGGDINVLLRNIQLGWDGCNSYFTGVLDEVALFKRTLTPEEIKDAYTKNLAGKSICAVDSPVKVEECKLNGWKKFGFKNQGSCMQYLKTGKDSRP